MKKYLFSLIVLVLAGQIGRAQLAIPRDSNYYYDWWYGDYFNNNPTHLVGTNHFGNGGIQCAILNYGMIEIASGQYADSALEVVGIALAQDPLSLSMLPGGRVEGYHDEYARLYKKINDSMVVVDEVQIIPIDSSHAKPFTMVDRIYTYTENGECDTILKVENFCIFEYYFDSPRMVTDSFYLGVTFNTDTVHTPEMPNGFWFRGGQAYGCYCNAIYFEDCDRVEAPTFPQFPYRYKWIHNQTGQVLSWQDTLLPVHLLLYPIIRYGSPVAACDTVDKFSLLSQEDSLFTFDWSPIGNQHEWQFTYVPYGMSPDSGVATNHTMTQASVVVEPNVRYQAYARAVCPGDRHGDWSHPEEFIYAVDTHSTPRYRLTLLPTSSSMGTVAGGGIYDSASMADIVAMPNSGFRFAHWNDGNEENPRTIVVVSDTTFTAIFEAGGQEESIAEAEAAHITLSPNPTSGKVKVSASEPMRQAAVYDMAGKEVFSAKAVVPKTEWDLDLGSLPSGSYIVKITTKSRTATRKLIVE